MADAGLLLFLSRNSWNCIKVNKKLAKSKKIAKKFKIPVVPIFIDRSNNTNFKMKVFKPLDFSDESSIENITIKLNKILEKVGEEATEVILAAKDTAQGGEQAALINEVADLWFHTLVMLSHLDADHKAVLEVLDKRMGLSGLTEKASRNSHNDASDEA